MEDRNLYAITKIGNSIFAGGDSGLYYTEDIGHTWIHADGILSETNIQALLPIDGMILAGSYNKGLFASVNVGKQWQALPSPNEIETLAMDSSYLYMGTGRSGVYRNTIAGLFKDAVPIHTANDYAVSITASPNPFSESTVVHVSPAVKSHFSIEILTLEGRFVASLFDGILEAGEHSFTWNAATMPSGTYLVRIVCEGNVQLARLIHQK